MNRRSFIQTAGALALRCPPHPRIRSHPDDRHHPVQARHSRCRRSPTSRHALPVPAGRWKWSPRTGTAASPAATCASWRPEWQNLDWRAVEAELNRYEQVMIDHDGGQVHAFHIRSPHADALPLVLCHGWPSSGIEYLKLFEPLTNPTAFGGKAEDAFHLIVPTSPGFGLSPDTDCPRLDDQEDGRSGGESCSTSSAASALACTAPTWVPIPSPSST